MSSEDQPIGFRQLKQALNPRIGIPRFLQDQRLDLTRKSQPAQKSIDNRSLTERLVEAQKHSPRFLLRAWVNTTDAVSGGYLDLNTKSAVTPLAYLTRLVNSIFDQSESALRDMLEGHLWGLGTAEDTPFTQSSSWAASLSVAFPFAAYPNAYVSVIDTKLLLNAVVLHVPDLQFLVPQMNMNYHWEYLVYGIIDGVCYQAIPMKAFTDLDFPGDYNWGAHPYIPHDPVRWQSIDTATRLEPGCLYDAQEIAKRYGCSFVLPVFLGVVCQRFKHPDYYLETKQVRNEVLTIVAFVERLGLSVPYDWCFERSIMQDSAVSMDRYGDVRVMLLCMRLLVAGKYTEEIARRWPRLGSRKERLKDGISQGLRDPETKTRRVQRASLRLNDVAAASRFI